MAEVIENGAAKKKLRVLIYTVAFYPKVDGISNRMKHLLTNLKKFGYEVIVLCPYEKAPDQYEGIPFVKLPSFQPLWYSESKLAYPFPVLTLLNVFTSFKPDVVHVVGPEFILFSFVGFCKLLGIPLVGSYHFFLSAWLENQDLFTKFSLGWLQILERIQNSCDYVITPSHPMRQILNDKWMKCNDVWPPAVDSKIFHPGFSSKEMREMMTFGNPNAILVVYVGRIATEKNLEILPRILEVNPNAYLALIGGGDQAPEWKAKHGPENRIFCTGEHWFGEKLSMAYASADIFVLPSNFEALGNVILEAMASGVATVGCNAGGVPHMIKDRQNGLLFERFDADGLANCVRELIEDPDLRKRLATTGRKYAETINWEASSAYVAEIYERVVKFKAEGKSVNFTEQFPSKKSQNPNHYLGYFKIILPILLVAILLNFLLSSF